MIAALKTHFRHLQTFSDTSTNCHSVPRFLLVLLSMSLHNPSSQVGDGHAFHESWQVHQKGKTLRSRKDKEGSRRLQPMEGCRDLSFVQICLDLLGCGNPGDALFHVPCLPEEWSYKHSGCSTQCYATQDSGRATCLGREMWRNHLLITNRIIMEIIV